MPGKGHGAKPQSTIDKYIDVCCDPTLFTDKDKIAAMNGSISESTFYNWQQDAELNARIDERIKQNSKQALAAMYRAIIDKGLNGDVSAMKLYMELQKEYSIRLEQSGDINININVEE